jgi:hypothetical protein
MKNNFNKKTKKDKQGKILLAATSLFLVSAFVIGQSIDKRNEDPNTYCSKDVKKKHIIFLDHSSKLRSDSLAQILKEIEHIISKVKPGEEIEFQKMNQDLPDYTLPIDIDKNMKSICRPVRQFSNKIVSEIFENFELKNKTFELKINNFLKKDYLSKFSEASYSPISTRINNILTSNLGRNLKLHIFSDFMELTKNINVYKCFGIEKAKLKKVDSRLHFYKLPVDPKYNECRNTFVTEISQDRDTPIIDITGEST